MRGGLVVLGLLFLIGSWLVSSVFTAQEQSQLQLAGGVCNSGLGSLGSSISSTVANDCQQINNINAILNLVPIGYLLGIVFLLVGLVSRAKTKTEPTHVPHNQDIAEESKETKVSENEPLKLLKIRYAKGDITKKQFDQMKKDLE